MISPLRSLKLGIVPAVFSVGALVGGCTDPDIRLTAVPAQIPGVSIGPFTSGSATTLATINVASVRGFSGFVNFSATCCYNVIQEGGWNSPPAGQVVWFFATDPVNVPSGGSASSVMTIFMPALSSGPYPNLGPNIPFGKHLIAVHGLSQSGKASSSANVGITVLPSSEPAPGCKPGVEVIPLTTGATTTGGTPAPTGILQMLIAAAETSPRTKSSSIAVYRATGPDVGTEAFTLTFTDNPGLKPSRARVILQHKSTKNEDKEISTHGCSSAPKNVVATKGNTSVVLELDQAADRTMVLREKSVCNNVLCTSTSWANVMVFPEPAFWSVFGGKNVRIEWHECTPFLLWCV